MDVAVVEEARALVMGATSPHSDFRGSAEYRRTMAGELFARALKAAQLRSRGEPAAVGYL